MSEEWGQSIYDRMLRSMESSRREQRSSRTSSSMQVHNSSSSQERRSNSSTQDDRSSSNTRSGSASRFFDGFRRGAGRGGNQSSEQSRLGGSPQQSTLAPGQEQSAAARTTGRHQDQNGSSRADPGNGKPQPPGSSSSQQALKTSQPSSAGQASSAPASEGTGGAQGDSTSGEQQSHGGDTVSQQNPSGPVPEGSSGQQSAAQPNFRSQLNRGDYFEGDLEEQRPASDQRSLTESLLGGYTNIDDDKPAAGGPPGPAPNSGARKSSLPQSSANLANTVVGAGIMSLPHAIAVLGILFGSGMLILIYALARLSLAKLIRFTEQCKAQSYSDLVRKQLGRAGDIYVQASIIINNAGILVVYLIILGDIAVGSPPKYDGLLSTWFGLDAGQTWFLKRPFVVAVLAGAFLLPLSLLRDLSALSKVSAVSLALSGFFATACGGLGAYAAFQGTDNSIYDILSQARWWPSLDELTSPKKLSGLIATLPVLLTSFVCHYNLHPVMKDLQNYSQKRMTGAVDLGLGSCTLAYIISGIGGYFLFSGHPAEDVLKSFTPAALAPVLGPSLASKTEVAIRASYLIVLLCHAPIVSFGLRELLLEKVFKGKEVHGGAYTGTTILIVAVSYIASVVIPNVWTFLQVTGATAALSLAYVIPAMLMLKLDKAASQKGTAWTILVGSAITCVTSVVHTLRQAV